jgi:HD superfamily phosphohydrolase
MIMLMKWLLFLLLFIVMVSQECINENDLKIQEKIQEKTQEKIEISNLQFVSFDLQSQEKIDYKSNNNDKNRDMKTTLFTDFVYPDGIYVTKIAQNIINTEWFQKLRYIRQLGICYFVYSSASTSRFEHSIGVYHFTGLMLNVLRNQDPNKVYDIPHYGKTKLTPEFIEKVKIAGLTHDIGHGPYSHLYDEMVEEKYPNLHHEARSKMIIDIVLREKTNYTDIDILLIKNLIDPPEDCKHHFLFTIVANSIGGPDADKFDYLRRDSLQVGEGNPFEAGKIINEIKLIDGKIAYPESVASDIHKLFVTRHLLHKKVYGHVTIKAIELMIKDILKLIDPIIEMIDAVLDMKKFRKLTGDSLFRIFDMYDIDNLHDLEPHHHKNFKKAYEIYQRIMTRDRYKIIKTHQDCLEEIYHIISKNPKYENEIYMKKMKIGFTAPSKPQPFNNIYFYSPSTLKIHTKKPSEINPLVTDNYYETFILIIVKSNSIMDEIEKEIEKIALQLA